MHRTLLIGTVLGSALLLAGCTGNNDAPDTKVFPKPVVATMEPEGITSTLTGFATDPEAFFMGVGACGPACPAPPLYNEAIPFFSGALVPNTPVTALDLANGQPAGQPSLSNAKGMWAVSKVPSRESPPYVMLSPGSPGTPLGAPPSVTVNYVPTATFRPIAPAHSICTSLEVARLSDQGVLEAVAKYLSSAGPPVTVQDLLNPTKYSGVMVFWLYRPGFPTLRAPADSTTVVATKTEGGVEVPAGQVLNLVWSPPGQLPPPLDALTPIQSTRGWVVIPGAPASPLGMVVVLHPASSNPGLVNYTVKDMKDPSSAPQEQRPWVFQPLTLPSVPGVAVFLGLQLVIPSPGAVAGVPPPTACAPTGP